MTDELILKYMIKLQHKYRSIDIQTEYLIPIHQKGGGIYSRGHIDGRDVRSQPTPRHQEYDITNELMLRQRPAYIWGSGTKEVLDEALSTTLSSVLPVSGIRFFLASSSRSSVELTRDSIKILNIKHHHMMNEESFTILLEGKGSTYSNYTLLIDLSPDNLYKLFYLLSPDQVSKKISKELKPEDLEMSDFDKRIEEMVRNQIYTWEFPSEEEAAPPLMDRPIGEVYWVDNNNDMYTAEAIEQLETEMDYLAENIVNGNLAPDADTIRQIERILL